MNFENVSRKHLETYADYVTKFVMDLWLEENNEMGLYGMLLGKGPWKIEAFPDAGHNYVAVIDAIYRYSINNPQVQTATILEDTLNKTAMKFISLDDFFTIMNILCFQLDCEKNNKSPFKINVTRILNTMRNRIVSTEKLNLCTKFMEEVRSYEKYLAQKYGLKIL